MKKFMKRLRSGLGFVIRYIVIFTTFAYLEL